MTRLNVLTVVFAAATCFMIGTLMLRVSQLERLALASTKLLLHTSEMSLDTARRMDSLEDVPEPSLRDAEPRMLTP